MNNLLNPKAFTLVKFPMKLPHFVISCLLVTSALSAAEPLQVVIDRKVRAAWAREKVEPVQLADDSTFLRRVYLDLVGTVPTYKEARVFLDDLAKDKRAKLVDKLLVDKRHAKHQMQIWDLIIFTRNPANPAFTRKRDHFKSWLEKQFAQNVPWDALVRKMMLAEEPGSAMFHVQYRNKPEDETVAVSRIFLGTQLQCARCHDHPFEDLSQKDFYGMAGFFVRLQVLQETKGKEKVYTIGEKSSGDVLFTGPAADAVPGKKGEPVKPKFLGGAALKEPEIPKDFKEPDYRKIKKGPYPKPFFSRKEKLAAWMTSTDNPYFARAAVNRVWSQFMGRGLVHPVDDLKPDSEASHPALLDALAKEFVAHKFDLRWLMKEIMLSKTYQRDSAGPGTVAAPKWYERARVRPLSAEELIDAMRVATGFNVAEGMEAKMPSSASSYMLKIFGKPTDGRGNFQGGVPEHLYLNNGSQLRSIIRAKKGNLADTLLKSEAPWDERVDHLMLATLTRLPSSTEREKLVAYITEKKDDPRETQERLEEATWALLNSARFRFNY
jgi:hypothetical protein